MGRPAASWSEFEAAAPELARSGRRLLEDGAGVPGVAFLGTVAGDGTPRIHPFTPAVRDGELWAFLTASPKQRDLDRSASFAIHSRLGEDDESFFCAGSSSRVEAAAVRAAVAGAMPYEDVDDQHLLYRFRLSRALWTTWTTPTTPAHRSWTIRDA